MNNVFKIEKLISNFLYFMKIKNSLSCIDSVYIIPKNNYYFNIVYEIKKLDNNFSNI